MPWLATDNGRPFTRSRAELSGSLKSLTADNALPFPQPTDDDFLFDFDDVLEDLANDVARGTARKDVAGTTIAELLEELFR